MSSVSEDPCLSNEFNRIFVSQDSPYIKFRSIYDRNGPDSLFKKFIFPNIGPAICRSLKLFSELYKLIEEGKTSTAKEKAARLDENLRMIAIHIAILEVSYYLAILDKKEIPGWLFWLYPVLRFNKAPSKREYFEIKNDIKNIMGGNANNGFGMLPMASGLWNDRIEDLEDARTEVQNLNDHIPEKSDVVVRIGGILFTLTILSAAIVGMTNDVGLLYILL